MLQLPNSQNPTGLEKYLKYILLAGAGVAVFWFWGTIVPFVVATLENTLKTVVYGGILAAVLLFIWQYPQFISMTYKTICRKIQAFFIKMDPLSYMDRYADLLLEKIKNLRTSIQVLQGKKQKIDRLIDALKENIETNRKEGKAALTLKKPNAALYGTKIAGDLESIRLYEPLQQRLDRSLTLMNKLHDGWLFDRENMVYQIERKRQEFEVIKETVKGLKNAEEMINSESQEAQIYGMSLKALEENVTQKMGYIEDFERRSKGIIDGIDVKMQSSQDEGLMLLEQYITQGNLTFGAELQTVDASHTVVSSKFLN